MTLYNSKTYINEIKSLQKSTILNDFENKTILLSGGTGLILSYFVDLFLLSNLNVQLILIVRNIEKAKERFSNFINDNRLEFIEGNLNTEIKIEKDSIDYVISGASKTDPYSYSHYPVETIIDNIAGCKNLLNIAKKFNAKFLLLSSCEIYGINENEILKEDDESVVKINENRSCYNLAKMTSENLCINYKKEYEVNTKIIRFSRIFGPTIKLSDTKALSQFMFNGINKKDIVLKSSGEQKFSYQYVADSVLAILYVLKDKSEFITFNSTNEEIYRLKDLAKIISDYCGTKVIFDIKDEFNGSGYSKAKNSILSIERLNTTGFKNQFNIQDALINTCKILSEIK